MLLPSSSIQQENPALSAVQQAYDYCVQLRGVALCYLVYQKMNLSGLTGSLSKNSVVLLAKERISGMVLHRNAAYVLCHVFIALWMLPLAVLQMTQAVLCLLFFRGAVLYWFTRVGTFILSWLVGTFLMVSVIPPIFKGLRNLEVTTSVISYVLLWISSTYLK